MAVPYTFGSATTSIPLSQLDSNFATAITLGNTAVQLGNTITTLTGVTNVASGTSLTLGSNGNTTAITIDTSQNVGIGTSSPATKLQVAGNRFRIGDANNDPGIEIYNGSIVKGYLFNDTANNLITLRHASSSGLNLDTSGNLLVGTTSSGTSRIYGVATGNFHGIRGTADTGGFVGTYGNHSVNSSTGYVAYFYNTGSSTGVYLANTASWQTLSDQRLKSDIKTLDSTQRLLQLQPKDYIWKSQQNEQSPKRNFGFIAQEVQEIFPDLVSVSPDGMYGVDYTGLIAPLVKAIQEQQALIQSLTDRITALEKK